MSLLRKRELGVEAQSVSISLSSFKKVALGKEGQHPNESFVNIDLSENERVSIGFIHLKSEKSAKAVVKSYNKGNLEIVGVFQQSSTDFELIESYLVEDKGKLLNSDSVPYYGIQPIGCSNHGHFVLDDILDPIKEEKRVEQRIADVTERLDAPLREAVMSQTLN